VCNTEHFSLRQAVYDARRDPRRILCCMSDRLSRGAHTLRTCRRAPGRPITAKRNVVNGQTIGIAVSVLALAAGQAQPGQSASARAVDLVTRECANCHGPRGISAASTFPNLAGQQPGYLQAQLTAFRDRSRADPHAQAFMWGMAAQLTDDVTAAIATYFAGLPAAPGKPAGAAEVAAGQSIYGEGIAAQHVAPCQSCHGKEGEGKGSFPRLTGQHRDYLEKQMEAFATNLRANASMHENSKNLTALQISEVAAFLSAR